MLARSLTAQPSTASGFRHCVGQFSQTAEGPVAAAEALLFFSSQNHQQVSEVEEAMAVTAKGRSLEGGLWGVAGGG